MSSERPTPEAALLIDTYIRSSWTRPDSVVTDTDTWFQVRTPSVRENNMNCVRRVVLAPDTAEARIAAVVADHEERDAVLHWTFSEACRPLDLVRRLQSHGFTVGATTLGMVRDCSSVATPGGIEVDEIGFEGLDTYIDAAAAGWDQSPASAAEMRSDIAANLLRETREVRYFVARVGGEVAGTGALREMPGRGYLLGSSVCAPFRGRGVYRALLAERIRWLAANGTDLAAIVAMETTSAPIVARLGFREVCRFRHLKRRPTGLR